VAMPDSSRAASGSSLVCTHTRQPTLAIASSCILTAVWALQHLNTAAADTLRYTPRHWPAMVSHQHCVQEAAVPCRRPCVRLQLAQPFHA
jgi:hypothetical protein